MLESSRTSTFLVASQLENKKQSMVTKISLDKVSNEGYGIIEKIAFRLFEELSLKSVSHPALLVGLEGRSHSANSTTSSRDSRVEPKRAITQYLRRLSKPRPVPGVNLSALSTCPQESQANVSHHYIDLEQS